MTLFFIALNKSQYERLHKMFIKSLTPLYIVFTLEPYHNM